MKNLFKIILSLVILVGLTTTSCVKDKFDDPEIPDWCAQTTGWTPNITIKGISEKFETLEVVDESTVKIFPNEDIILEATVVSNDEAGNFYKILYLEDATGALSLSIEGSNLFNDYRVGQTVHLNLSGLTIEFDDWVGINEIGMGTFIKDGAIGGIGRIPVSTLSSFLKSESCPNELTPTVIDLYGNNNNNLGRLVKIDNVQFTKADLGSTYADALSNPPASASRTIEDCDGNPITLRTSGYAAFASVVIPEGRGSIMGIYTKYGTTYQLVIRDLDDVDFNKARCGGLEILGTSKVVSTLNNNFENGTPGKDYILDGWLNANFQGERYWRAKGNSTNKYLEVAGFDALATDIESWVVSPGVAVTAGQKLNFDTKVGFWNHVALTVYISTDFDGTHEHLANSTWIDVSSQCSIPTEPSSGFGTIFTNSEVDLSSYAGQTVYILFKYTGKNSGNTTFVQLDNVIISN